MDSICKFITEQKALLAKEKNRLFELEKKPVDALQPTDVNNRTPCLIDINVEEVQGESSDESLGLVNERLGGSEKFNFSEEMEHQVNNNSSPESESSMASYKRMILQSTAKNDLAGQKDRAIFNDPFKYYDHIMINSRNNEHNKENFNVGETTRHKSNFQPQPFKDTEKHEMEQGVTDAFYSHFPSFNEDDAKKRSLSRARQLEYQLYLKNIPEIPSKSKLLKSKLLEYELQQKQEQGNSSNNNDSLSKFLNQALDTDETSKYRKGSPRHKLMQDLRHIDLPTILNSDTVDLKNKLIAEQEVQKKMDYQKELIKQIEEKRKEVERLRLKEKEEEELLTKRLEQQLKTMELEDELDKEKKRTEKIRLANEQNHIRRLQLLSKLENDNKIQNHNTNEENRKSRSENGKDMYKKKGEKAKDDKIYRYFSNSAKYDNKLTTRLYNRSIDLSDEEEKIQDLSHSSLCKKCLANSSVPIKKKDCIHCGYHERISPIKNNLCLDCHLNLDKILKFCSNCKELLHDNCVNCSRNLSDTCINCNNSRISSFPRIQEDPDGDSDRYRKVESPPLSYRTFQRGYAAESDTDFETSSRTTPIILRKHTEPYSMNVDEKSVFNPRNKLTEPKIGVNIRNGEIFVDKIINDEEDIEKLKSQLDDRISKYVRNYDDLWRVKKASPIYNTKTNSVPVNKIKVKSIKSYTVNHNKDDQLQFAKERSKAMKVLERKWDVPAVQKITVDENSTPKVLTQLGAIRKQLQLEQLNMDQTYSN